MSFFRSLPRARKSHSICNPYQKFSVWPKNAPNRIDIRGVIERCPRTISLTARGGTPIARAIAFCEMPMGFKYSSSRISPGEMGGFMDITYSVIRSSSMVVADGDFCGTGIGPAEGDAPLVVDSNGMKSLEVALECFEPVAGRNGEVCQSRGMIPLNELPQRNASDGGKATVALLSEEFVRIFVCERLDHGWFLITRQETSPGETSISARSASVRSSASGGVRPGVNGARRGASRLRRR